MDLGWVPPKLSRHMLNLYGGQVIKTVIGAFRALRPAYGSTAESLCADAMREFGQYNPCEKD